MSDAWLVAIAFALLIALSLWSMKEQQELEEDETGGGYFPPRGADDN